MKKIIALLFLFIALHSWAQDGFFQWKMQHPEKMRLLLDSSSIAITEQTHVLLPILALDTKADFMIKTISSKREKEVKASIRFWTLNQAMHEWINDSISFILIKKNLLLSDSFPEAHRLTIAGYDKIIQELSLLPKNVWPKLVEKEMALWEWEFVQEELSKKQDPSVLMSDLVSWMYEASWIKPQMLMWEGISSRSKQLYSIKLNAKEEITLKNWAYFQGCDSNWVPFSVEIWKENVKRQDPNFWEKEHAEESRYFNGLEKQRLVWEYLDKRQNILDKMNAYVIQYEQQFAIQDSLKGLEVLRARSAQELIDKKRARELWRIEFYRKGIDELEQIGSEIEGGPTVVDHSKQSKYFRLKDQQNIFSPRPISVPKIDLETEETAAEVSQINKRILKFPTLGPNINSFQTLK
jgi:hypothetical protein